MVLGLLGHKERRGLMGSQHEDLAAGFAAQARAHADRGIVPVAVWMGDHTMFLNDELRDRLHVGDYLFVVSDEMSGLGGDE